MWFERTNLKSFYLIGFSVIATAAATLILLVNSVIRVSCYTWSLYFACKPEVGSWRSQWVLTDTVRKETAITKSHKLKKKKKNIWSSEVWIGPVTKWWWGSIWRSWYGSWDYVVIFPSQVSYDKGGTVRGSLGLTWIALKKAPFFVEICIHRPRKVPSPIITLLPTHEFLRAWPWHYMRSLSLSLSWNSYALAFPVIHRCIQVISNAFGLYEFDFQWWRLSQWWRLRIGSTI